MPKVERETKPPAHYLEAVRIRASAISPTLSTEGYFSPGIMTEDLGEK